AHGKTRVEKPKEFENTGISRTVGLPKSYGTAGLFKMLLAILAWRTAGITPKDVGEVVARCENPTELPPGCAFLCVGSHFFLARSTFCRDIYSPGEMPTSALNRALSLDSDRPMNLASRLTLSMHSVFSAINRCTLAISAETRLVDTCDALSTSKRNRRSRF